VDCCIHILPCNVNSLHYLCIHGVCNSRQGVAGKRSKPLKATKGSSISCTTRILYSTCLLCCSWIKECLSSRQCTATHIVTAPQHCTTSDLCWTIQGTFPLTTVSSEILSASLLSPRLFRANAKSGRSTRSSVGTSWLTILTRTSLQNLSLVQVLRMFRTLWLKAWPPVWRKTGNTCRGLACSFPSLVLSCLKPHRELSFELLNKKRAEHHPHPIYFLHQHRRAQCRELCQD
jgi:hypothetical protein